MSRPQKRPRERVRVELRLPPQIAEMLYDSAHEWDVSLSEAGARLIRHGRAPGNREATRTT